MASHTRGGRRAAGSLIIRRVARGFFRHHCPDAAAGLTFYTLLAAFPAAIAAFSVIGLFGAKRDAAKAVLDVLRGVVPEDAVQTLKEPLEQVAEAAGAGWVLLAALGVALWSVARYVTAFGRAMNGIYGVPEGRMFWKAKPTHLLVTLALFLLVSVASALAAVTWPLAQSLGQGIGVGDAALTVWRIGRWPALVLVVFLAVAVLFYYAPNVEHPRFRVISVGAVLAIVIFAAASFGFGFYVSKLADYDRIYGSFAGMVIFLLWLWIGNTALLLGVLIDAELERVRELRSGVAAERQLQVPLRDAQRVARNAAKDIADERRAQRLRRRR